MYRWCPLLWPFVIAHGVYDILLAIETYGSPHAGTVADVVLDVLAAVGVIAGTWLVAGWVRVRFAA